ncbi:MAG: metallophosphoesterase [Flavobacteriales bacterium]
MARIIFATIFVTFILSLDLYIWSAFKTYFVSNPVVKYLYWMISILTIAAIFYPAINSNMTLYPGYMVVIFGFIFAIVASKMTVAFPLIIDDVIRLFKQLYRLLFSSTDQSSVAEPITRLNFLKKTAFGFGAVTLSLLTYGILIGRYNFKKHFVKLNLKNYPKGEKPLRIIQISDLHLGSFQSVSKLTEAVNLINNENPDLIVFTGDLVNNFPSEARPFVEVMKKLKAKYGKYSVLGNHDYADYIGLNRSTELGLSKWNESFQEMLSIHKSMGFDLLLNETRVLKVSNVEINIVGVENWGSGRFSKYGDLNKALENSKENIPTFLLSHDPTHWESKVLKSDQHIDLQMAGHTHGMQFGVEVGKFKWSPVKWRYKHWAGLYQKGNNYLYVNRGIGHLGYPGRVGILPEISIIDVQSA